MYFQFFNPSASGRWRLEGVLIVLFGVIGSTYNAYYPTCMDEMWELIIKSLTYVDYIFFDFKIKVSNRD